MIESDVKDDLEVAPMTLFDQELKVFHGAEDGIDLVVVADVVSRAIGETDRPTTGLDIASSLDLPHI